MFRLMYCLKLQKQVIERAFFPVSPPICIVSSLQRTPLQHANLYCYYSLCCYEVGSPLDDLDRLNFYLSPHLLPRLKRGRQLALIRRQHNQILLLGFMVRFRPFVPLTYLTFDTFQALFKSSF